MNPRISVVRNEKGVALPLALFALVSLTAFVLTFVSMGGMEPQVSRNLSDGKQARYVAEAGIEWAFDQLALAPSYSALLQGPPVAGSNPQAAWLTAPANTQIPLPGLTANFGTYTVQVRNDVLPTDTALTGLPPEGNTTIDTNGALVITATGIYNGVTRQIQVVMRRVSLPPFPGAYSMPGAQADLWFANANFDIDGRDWICTANCNDPDPANRTYAVNPSQSKRKYGIATQTGIQQNSNPQVSYEQRAEYRLDTAAKQSRVQGKDQTNPGASTTGLNTVAADASLNPAVMQNFLDQLAQFQATTVLQSTMACPMALSGNAADPSKPKLTNGCGVNQQLDLGSRTNPKLVYFRGDLDPTSTFTGVRLQGSKIQGSGILIIEDGDFRVTNQFDWDGVVIVQGRYVSSIFESGSDVKIYGATVSNETIWNEGGNQNQTPYWDGHFNSLNSVALRNSQQALDLVQRALLFRMSTWREL